MEPKKKERSYTLVKYIMFCAKSSQLPRSIVHTLNIMNNVDLMLIFFLPGKYQTRIFARSSIFSWSVNLVYFTEWSLFTAWKSRLWKCQECTKKHFFHFVLLKMLNFSKLTRLSRFGPIIVGGSSYLPDLMISPGKHMFSNISYDQSWK